jgi:hypothetical protein
MLGDYDIHAGGDLIRCGAPFPKGGQVQPYALRCELLEPGSIRCAIAFLAWLRRSRCRCRRALRTS